MPLDLEDMKLVASQGSTGEVWANGSGRFAFIPYGKKLEKELTERSTDVADLLFDLVETHFRVE